MSVLYIVPTPIGNLEDITLRALRVLREADVILAEDTRTTGILLKHYDISKPVISHHMHNEHKTVSLLAERIRNGESIALVSDAGTPGISDPGYLLIRECLLNDIKVECLPGPTSFVPALVASGIPCDHFIFEGFLPPKKGRVQKLNALAESNYTLVFFESSHRLLKTLQQFVQFFGEDRKAVVAREISKFHEEYNRGTLKELTEEYKNRQIKGEIVIIVAKKN